MTNPKSFHEGYTSASASTTTTSTSENEDTSGNGDGTAVNYDSSISSGEREMIDTNDRHFFLHGRSPAVLYLWKKANEHLLSTVC